MRSIFETETKLELENRVESLSESSNAHWGKMNAGQMLWHCQFPLEIAIKNENKGNGKLLMKLFKKSLYNEKPFKQNLLTAKQLKATEEKDFDAEKTKLLQLIHKTHELKNRTTWQPHPFFGEFTHEQWGILEYKHLDHHLTQFGV